MNPEDEAIKNAEYGRNWAARKRGEVFSALESKPEQWQYNGGCNYVEEEVQCQLCETMIKYRYPLTENDTNRSLQVGHECIVNFYEAYFPNGLDVVLDMMKKAFNATRHEVIAKKLAKFRESHQHIVEFLLDSAASKMRKFRSVKIFRNGFSKIVSTAFFRAILKRRGYLKTEEIEAIEVNVGNWRDSLKKCPQCGRLKQQHEQGLCTGPINGWGAIPLPG